jgi:hypothetical protein
VVNGSGAGELDTAAVVEAVAGFDATVVAGEAAVAGETVVGCEALAAGCEPIGARPV